MEMEMEWLIGLGIMFGFALAMNYMTFKNMNGFVAYILMFNAFVVWANLLPMWTLIACIVALTLTTYFTVSERGI